MTIYRLRGIAHILSYLSEHLIIPRSHFDNLCKWTIAIIREFECSIGLGLLSGFVEGSCEALEEKEVWRAVLPHGQQHWGGRGCASLLCILELTTWVCSLVLLGLSERESCKLQHFCSSVSFPGEMSFLISIAETSNVFVLPKRCGITEAVSWSGTVPESLKGSLLKWFFWRNRQMCFWICHPKLQSGPAIREMMLRKGVLLLKCTQSHQN